MKIYLSPQVGTNKNTIKINGEQVQVDNKLYDFTNLPNGSLRQPNADIISARRVNSELHVEIINSLDDTATQDELFPQWQTVERNDILDSNLAIVVIDWYNDDERQADELVNALQPTLQELSKAERDLETIELLIEMGLI